MKSILLIVVINYNSDLGRPSVTDYIFQNVPFTVIRTVMNPT